MGFLGIAGSPVAAWLTDSPAILDAPVIVQKYVLTAAAFLDTAPTLTAGTFGQRYVVYSVGLADSSPTPSAATFNQALDANDVGIGSSTVDVARLRQYQVFAGVPIIIPPWMLTATDFSLVVFAAFYGGYGGEVPKPIAGDGTPAPMSGISGYDEPSSGEIVGMASPSVSAIQGGQVPQTIIGAP